MNEIIKNINKRKSNIGVLGLGYVGLPLAIRFSEEKFKVVGFDIDAEKLHMLNAGKSFINHISEKKISAMVKAGFRATDDFGKISDIDIIIICVPTPLGVHNEPDLSYVKQTLKSITPYLKEKQLLVLEKMAENCCGSSALSREVRVPSAPSREPRVVLLKPRGHEAGQPRRTAAPRCRPEYPSNAEGAPPPPPHQTR